MTDSFVHKFGVAAIAGTTVLCLGILTVHSFGLAKVLAGLLVICTLAALVVYRIPVAGAVSRLMVRVGAQRTRWRQARMEREKTQFEQTKRAVAELPIRHFHTKVVGVTRLNEDGSDRQRIIKRCVCHEEVCLQHDIENEYDSNAITVCRANGHQIGFLSAELAEQIVKKTGSDRRYSAFISSLTGGTRSKPTRGVNLLIIESGPTVGPRDIQKYLRTVRLE